MLTSNDLLLLLVLLSTAQATKPNCTHVADFDDCQGNAPDFCPKGIACACKNQMPFCKCPSYRNHWQNYWYMGPRCDQIWSTLDLIVVAVLPAVTLSIAAMVMMQWVGWCNSKPGKAVKQGREPRLQAQHNPGHAPNLTDNKRLGSQPQGRMDGYELPKVLPQHHSNEQQQPQHLEGFSYIPQRPLRRTGPLDNYAFMGQSRSQAGQPGYSERAFPAVDYKEMNPFSSIPMPQFSKSGASAFPRPDSHETSPYRVGHSPNIYA